MDQSFTPVPTRTRRDGWTPARQHAFIAALAETRCIAAACRRVGLSPRSAYTLRARADARSFAAAWDEALSQAFAPPDGRAVGGVARPILYRGKQVGERRRHDNRLGMFLLARRRPDRFGRASAIWHDEDADAEDFAPVPISPAPYHADRELPRRDAASNPVTPRRPAATAAAPAHEIHRPLHGPADRGAAVLDARHRGDAADP